MKTLLLNGDSCVPPCVRETNAYQRGVEIMAAYRADRAKHEGARRYREVLAWGADNVRRAAMTYGRREGVAACV